MEDVLLMLVVIIFMIIGYYLMGRVDKAIEPATDYVTPSILVIYDHEFLNSIKDFNEKILFLEKSLAQDVRQQFHSVVLCTTDDFYNLMMNYHVKKDLHQCQVYAYCNDMNYIHLYQNEGIHILEREEDVKELLDRLYEETME